ncbi:MAG: hypothetical protein HY743_12420 [Deltaproteobacteria bacterium]|nr:hypothetical protein [Deltaproteobacteria bacterium]
MAMTWVMLIIFILGVMAGRGDIYRWFSSWGLITPVSSKVAQWSPPAETPPAAAPANALPGTPAAAAAPATPPTSAVSPPPVTGSIAPTPAPVASPAKKGKKGASLRDQKAKDEELRRLRREVAAKLKFQNSFDSHPSKPARTAQKQKDKTAAASHKAQSRQVRVAQFRDLKAAKAKVAELQKKGGKVALKQGKDKKGVFYDIVREAPAIAQPADALAQKTQKSSGNKPKKPAGAEN